ncbi:MAG: hypothetical protein ACJATN_000943 [Neolewinella sp.]|jgi:hypothetical protein
MVTQVFRNVSQNEHSVVEESLYRPFVKYTFFR